MLEKRRVEGSEREKSEEKSGPNNGAEQGGKGGKTSESLRVDFLKTNTRQRRRLDLLQEKPS